MPFDDTLLPPSPFHVGEVALQRTRGVAERMERFGRRVIRDHLPDQHRDFFEQLPFVIAGTVDGQGDVWASLLSGQPGFVHSPDPQRLRFAVALSASDPAVAGLDEGAAIGLLGIELHSRRRNRMNGNIIDRNADGFSVEVDQSFGNCPQYIQSRSWHTVAPPATVSPEAEELPALDAAACATIAGADTFFVATYIDLPDGKRQIDASHRGGKPGFIRIGADGVLTIPDFAGNLHFNTLGNILLNPRAGLVFVDFQNGDLLQISGAAALQLSSPEIAAFQGAERLWTFTPTRIIRRKAALPLRFDFIDWSPKALMTGDWKEAAQRLLAVDPLIIPV